MATDDMEDKDQILENSMKAKLHTAVSPLSGKCCIFRVPEVLRRLNEKAYEPAIVAIGPYHRNKRSLQPMEDVKKWYLKNLLSRKNMSVLNLIKGIRESETLARACYQEPIDDEFMEIMILDGCFLVELFQTKAGLTLRSLDDPIFSIPHMPHYLYLDLLLLENQLPWFILQKLFDLTMPNDQRNFSLIELALKFFDVGSCFDSYECRMDETLHILDLMRGKLVSSYRDNDQTESSTCNDNQVEGVIGEHFRIPCVTRLLEAGVKFKKGSAGSMMNIKFTNGNFEIPPVVFHDLKKPLLRNLIVFEQCYHDRDPKITSYVVLMDKLINTDKDVEHLLDNGIIIDWLTAEDASQFFNGLHNDTFVTDFYYTKLCKSVNRHYRTNWHRWRATLMRQYFTSPWAIISLIGVIILLVLTFLQTFCSIKQSYF